MNFDAMASDMVHQANLVLANGVIDNNLPDDFVPPPIPEVTYLLPMAELVQGSFVIVPFFFFTSTRSHAVSKK